ncbi:hypothetical protein ppKF707_2358 [Metapseudomonas furukawaii]|nr:hypothetical protein ppKF707_2358 [Pseudomonas furukawaii]
MVPHLADAEEGRQGQVRRHTNAIVLVGDPVVAGHAIHLVLGIAAHEDVVTALADHFVETATADEDVVADHVIGQQRGEVVPRGAVLGTALDPVVALVAGGRQAGLGAVDEVVALAAEGGGNVLDGDDEILAVAPQDQVADAAGHHAAHQDHVIAFGPLQAVVAARVGEDVVAGATENGVIAIAALQLVVTAVAVEGVVAIAGDQDIVAGRTAEHHVVTTRVAQVVAIRPNRQGIVADHQRRDLHAVDQGAASRVGAAIEAKPGVLDGRIHLQGPGGGGEDGVRQVGHVGVQHHQLGEGVVLQLGAEMHACGTRQVIEAVGVLQGLQLGLEDEVEGGAEHAAEGHLLFRQATNPEVHRIQAGDGDAVGATGPGARAVQEIQAIGGLAGAPQHQQRRRGALVRQAGGAGDAGMGAIGRDEVDQGLRVLQVIEEVHPAAVGGQLLIARHLIEIAAGGVQRGNAGVAAPGDVQHRQVQGQAYQVVAQRLGDELVDLIAHGPGHATDDGPGGGLHRRPAGGEGQGIEEGGDQAHLLVGGGAQRVDGDRVEVSVEAIHRLGQHRVAEAVNRVGELGDDGRIDGGVIADRRQETVHLGLDGPRELLEHQVLVLHLGAELGGLEQALAVPVEGGGVGGDRSDRRQQPLVECRQVAGSQQGGLGLLHQAVVLGVEHMVHRGQPDVLVHPAVTGDVVGIQQFAVIGAGGLRTADHAIVVPHQACAGGGVGAVGDIDEELVAGAHRIGQIDGRGGVTLHQEIVGGADKAVRPLHHHHREAVGALDEIAVGIGGQQRHIEHIGIGQVDAEDVPGLGLDHRPGGHAADLAIVGAAEGAIRPQVAVGDQPPGGVGLAVGADLIGPQEHLVGRVRGIGLVLVDEGRGGVLVGPRDAAGLGGAGHDHEVGRAARHEERVIRLQRDEHDVVAALGHQVEAMVEELPEEGHPGIERRGETGVRRDIRDKQRLHIVGGAEQAVQAGTGDGGRTRRLCGGGGRGRIVGGLVDDQVADGTRLRIDDDAAALGIAGARLRRLEHRRQQAREQVVGGAELRLAEIQVVEGAIDGT